MPNQILEAALSYRRRGWSVIPVKNGLPAVKWQEYQQRLPTEEEIRDWWTRMPRANVALVTGKVSGIVAIDIDPRNGGNISQMWESAPTGLASMSGGGGAHLFFKHPGKEVHTRELQKGVELKGEGSNITLPPSVHRTGKRYEWAISDGPSKIPDFVMVPSVNGNKKALQEPWLVKLMAGVEEGDRNTAAARLAGYYISKKLPRDVVVQSMLNWDAHNDPPLGSDLISSTVDSVLRTDNRRVSERRESVSTSHVSTADEPFGLMKLDAYMSQFGDLPVTWAIEGWMPDQTIAMAVAPPGTYKTWMELALAVSVASGKPFLGKYPISRTGPVIVIQQEDFHGQMAERLAVVVGSLFDFGPSNNGTHFRFTPPPDLPIYLHPDRRFRFDDQVVIEALEEKIQQIKPALIIIDPLYSTGQIDDFGVGLVEMMWPLKAMRDKYKCSFFISHHTGKGKLETEREDAWGTQFLNAFIETGWQIRRKDQKNTAIIRRHFKVRPDVEEEVITFGISTEAPYSFDINIRSATAKEGVNPDIVQVIQQFGPITQAELVKKTGKDKSTVSRRLKNLEMAEIVARDNQNRYTATPLAAES